MYKNTLTFSQKDGLSSPNIHKISQDKYGFIWIATQDGLNRFDGREFLQFNSNLHGKYRLFSSDIRDIVLDDDRGLLWIICNQGGINCIDLATATTAMSFPYPKIKQEDDWKICAAFYNKKIYIGTSGGIEIFDTEKHLFTGAATLRQNSEQDRMALSSDIRTIAINEHGQMALGLLNKGIFFYDLAAQQGHLIHKTKGLNTGSFWPLSGIFINQNIFYCGLQDGLVAVDFTEKKIVKEQVNIPLHYTATVNAMTLNSRRQLFIATDNLIRFDLNKGFSTLVRALTYEMEPWLKGSTCIFQDRSQNIWVGSRLGLCLLINHDPVFGPVKNNAEKFNNKLDHVFAVCAVNDSITLVGTKNGLLEINKNKDIKIIYGKGLIQNIVRINKETILVSGYKGSFFYANGTLFSLTEKFPELKPFQNWQFNSYVKLNDSVSLFGTESNNGILEWHTKKAFVKQLHATGTGVSQLSSDVVNHVFFSKNKTAFILSDFFISAYTGAGSTPKQYKIETGLGNGIFMHMAEAKGSYWIAAYGQGLIQTDKTLRVKKVFGLAEGLTNTGVYSIFNYKDSLLILTSNFGISVFNIETKKISAYYEEDGLQSNVFEEASRDTFGESFLAGGTGGYVKIQPAKITVSLTPPQLYYTKLISESAARVVLDTSNFNVFNYFIPNDAVQTKIFFTGLHFQNAARVVYAYKITELGNYWINLNTQNFITLIGLSPGTYHLQVKAANEDGVWSEPKELILIFLPKWYQTWWFKLLVALTTAGIVYAFYRYRIAQIKKQHQIRKNIATDLHDDLGSTLNSVKVFTNLAISGVKQQESLQQVKDNLTEATMSLRDMIWVLDDSLDTVDELVTRLKQFALPITAASNMEFVINAGSDVNARTLSKEEKRNLFLICKEAINNSIKYSGASKITVDIIPSGKKIQITITDNGKGFDEATVKKGYGLKNMQYRAGQVKYKVTVLSKTERGTTVIIQQ